jgi:hypothetical protein
MTPEDKPRFAAAMTELAALKPGAKLTTLQYDAWWHALRDKWSLADFQRACAILRDTHEFMPNPFHFEELRQAQFGTAGELWSQALAHARTLSVSGGFLQERVSGNPLIDAAAQAIGGFKAIASAGCESLQFIEKRFCQRLEEIRDAEDVRAQLVDMTGGPRLPGPTSTAKLLGGAK